ncbi:MAG: hypothetical protein CMH62_00635, partial [Nanoarchaeota archaeon]|nr:hypothetical protein [Nanoarchaeota archaeon]
MYLNRKLIILVLLLILPIVYALNDADFEIERGAITIKAIPSDNEVYSNLIEFNDSFGNVTTASFDCSGGNCQGERAKKISFESVNIFIPGNYFFV